MLLPTEDVYRFEIPRMDKSCTPYNVLDLFNWLDIDAFRIDEYKENDSNGDYMRYVVQSYRCRRAANLKVYIQTNGFTEFMFGGVDWLIK